MAKPDIEPITEATLPEFAVFLNKHLYAGRTPGEWVDAFQVDWDPNRPNLGFMMRSGQDIVAGIGAFYSEQVIRDKVERFCNISSWCVLEPYRSHSMRLGMHITDQTGYHFTNFSPTAVVGGVLKFFKFQPLDDRQVMVPNPAHLVGTGEVLHDPAAISATLSGNALRIYQDHLRFPWLKQVLVGSASGWCHVVYKRGVVKRLPSATVLHLGDADIFNAHSTAFYRYLMARGMVTTRVELRLIKHVPRFSKILSGYNAKLFRSDTLTADDITCFYSETVAMDL